MLLLNGHVFSQARFVLDLGEPDDVDRYIEGLTELIDAERFPALRRAVDAGIFAPGGDDADTDFASASSGCSTAFERFGRAPRTLKPARTDLSPGSAADVGMATSPFPAPQGGAMEATIQKRPPIEITPRHQRPRSSGTGRSRSSLRDGLEPRSARPARLHGRAREGRGDPRRRGRRCHDPRRARPARSICAVVLADRGPARHRLVHGQRRRSASSSTSSGAPTASTSTARGCSSTRRPATCSA